MRTREQLYAEYISETTIEVDIAAALRSQRARAQTLDDATLPPGCRPPRAERVRLRIRGTLLYVASGERFELGWGPDPALRVHRQLDETEEESKLLSSWYRTERTVTDKLSNLGDSERSIELVEWVPVSEIDKLKIEVDRETTGRGADKNGMVRWTIFLKPFGHDTVRLRYAISRHSDVSGDF